MASCRQIENWLQSYLDNELGNADKLILEQHLTGCKGCEALLQQQKKTAAILFEALQDKRLHKDFTQQVLGHLPEMDMTQSLANETTWRTKNPHRITQRFFQLLPVFVPVLLLIFGLALYYAWPNDDYISNRVVGMVLQTHGDVMWSRDIDTIRRTARIEQWVNESDRFETSSESGLIIALVGPTNISLDVSTRIKIEDSRRITVESGRVWLDVSPEDRYFQVYTPTGRIMVFGTRFEVAVVNDETMVTVEHGEVQVENEVTFAVLRAGDRAKLSTNTSLLRENLESTETIAQWAKDMIPNAAAEASFIASISPEERVIVQAEQVFVVDTQNHKIKAIRLRWSESDSGTIESGYHVYVADDRMEPVFKKYLPKDIFLNASRREIDVEMPDSTALLNARILHIKLIPEKVHSQVDVIFNEIAAIGY